MNTNFSVWKTITIGNIKTLDEIKSAIISKGFRIGSWAEDVLNSSAFTLAIDESQIDLYKVTPRDLGFIDGAYLAEVYWRAGELGLKLCPLEVGPQLRIQYLDQPKKESLQIAMESQRDSEDHKSQFRVVYGGDGFVWLVGDHKHPKDFWKVDEPFIFTDCE